MAGTSGASDRKLQELMRKLAGIEPLTPSDVRAIDDQIPRRPRRPSRRALRVPDRELVVTDFKQIGEVYETGIAGLTERGWMEFGDTKYLGTGLYGRVTLGMWIKDRDKESHQRLLCAIKVQNIEKLVDAWKEVAIMRSLVHQNIIDYFDHFVVSANQGTTLAEAEQMVKMFKMDRNPGYQSPPRQESPSSSLHPAQQSRSRDKSPSVVMPYAMKTLWLITEFADAGNLMDEMRRYPDDLIPESGVLYYAKQILSALDYMHDRGICHCDLHLGNILLKYLVNRTKKCVITDFGRARIHTPDKFWYDTDWYNFVKNTTALICGSVSAAASDCTVRSLRKPAHLKKLGRSQAACDFIEQFFSRRRCPKTAHQMWSVPWIAEGRAVPPIPPLDARIKSQSATSGPSEGTHKSQQSRTHGQRPLDPLPEVTSDEERSETLHHPAAPPDADLRESRAGLGSRIRRSFSSFSHNVAHSVSVCGHCFRPRAE